VYEDDDYIGPPETHVQFLLGNVCNYSCWYCPDHLRRGDAQWASQEALSNAVSRLAAEVRMSGRTPRFEFQGGEPTVNEGIIYGLNSTGGNQPGGNRLVTNGSADLEWWEQHYDHFSSVEISYHTAYADIEHITAVCRFLESVEEPPVVSIKVHATNNDVQWSQALDAYEQLCERGLSAELKLLYSNFTQGNQYMPYKTYQLKQYYQTRGETFDPTPTEWVDPTGYIPENLRRHVIDESTTGFSTEENRNGKPVSHNYQGRRCWAGIEQLVVLPDGNVYRGWCRAGGSLGNLLDYSFRMPEEPIECPLFKCRNGFDRQATKED